MKLRVAKKIARLRHTHWKRGPQRWSTVLAAFARLSQWERRILAWPPPKLRAQWSAEAARQPVAIKIRVAA